MTPFHSPFRDALPPIEPGSVPQAMRPHIEAIRRQGRRRRAIGFMVGVLFYSSLLLLGAFAAWVFALATDRAVPTKTKVEAATLVEGPGKDLDLAVTPHLLRLCEGKVMFQARDREGNIVHQSDTGWDFPTAPLGPDKTFKRKLRISRDAVESEVNGDGRLKLDAYLRVKREYYCNLVQKLLGWPIVDVMPDKPFAIGSGQ